MSALPFIVLLAAQSPSPFDTPDLPPIERRVETLEQKVAAIEKTLAGMTAPKAKAAYPAKVVQQAYRSPPGYHRHVTNDGRIIEHRDGSGDHAGMSMVQYTGPRAPTNRVDSSAFTIHQMHPLEIMNNCPNGNCAAPSRRGIFGRWRR